MRQDHHRSLAIAASIVVGSFMGLTGCSNSLVPASSENLQAVSGNWQVSSVAASASKLPMLAGELTGSGLR